MVEGLNPSTIFLFIMKPILDKPCSNCPFKIEGGVRISRARAEEIAEALLCGESFSCHKLNDFSCGEVLITQKSRHCGGAASILDKMGRPNTAMQIASRMAAAGMGGVEYDIPDGSETFDTLDEWVNSNL